MKRGNCDVKALTRPDDRATNLLVFLATPLDAHIDLLAAARGKRFGTILADPPWQFQNRTGKVAPEHKRLNRYGTMTLDEIAAPPAATS